MHVCCVSLCGVASVCVPVCMHVLCLCVSARAHAPLKISCRASLCVGLGDPSTPTHRCAPCPPSIQTRACKPRDVELESTTMTTTIATIATIATQSFSFQRNTNPHYRFDRRAKVSKQRSAPIGNVKDFSLSSPLPPPPPPPLPPSRTPPPPALRESRRRRVFQ
jgi:hypothetical protein